jgi:hypothetical protein
VLKPGGYLKFDHQYLGNNYRMTDLVAAIGNAQLGRIKETLQTRRKKVQYYREGLKNVRFPDELSNTVNCHFFFLILADSRDSLNSYLNKNGIDTRITYPKPINEQPLFRKYSKETLAMAKKIPELMDENRERFIAGAVKNNIFGGTSRSLDLILSGSPSFKTDSIAFSTSSYMFFMKSLRSFQRGRLTFQYP